MAAAQNPANPKRRLGRGLSGLIINSAEEAQPPTAEYVGDEAPGDKATTPVAADQGPQPALRDLRVEDIAPNPYQPRRDFDQADLAALADSIRRDGLLQPLLVAPAPPASPRPYVLIAGERRLRAARQAGLPAVPCCLRQATGPQLLEWALIENIHRADLNPVERAAAYREYIDRFGLTQAQAAERLGEPRANLANHLRILDLPDDILEMLTGGALSFGHAKVLAGVGGEPDRQTALARRCVRAGLSVRQLEQLAAAGGDGAPRRPRATPPYQRDLEEQLTRAVGTRVEIRPGRSKHVGRVVIHYYSLEDFDRITGALGAQLAS
jgi:ParB family chromosome partitioning protein